jgi:hypothetical protein
VSDAENASGRIVPNRRRFSSSTSARRSNVGLPLRRITMIGVIVINAKKCESGAEVN